MYRQRRLRQEELRSLTGTAEEMLDQSIERIETAIRYNRYTLIASGPAFFVATLFAATADRQGDAIFGSLRDAPWLRFIWLGAWVATIGGLVVFLVAAIRRGRREIGTSAFDARGLPTGARFRLTLILLLLEATVLPCPP